MAQVIADGSSRADAPDRIEIDTSKEYIVWKYRCPNGHRSFTPTNGGIWCKECANDPDTDDPHWHAILNVQTDEEIPWSAVVLK